MAIVSALTGIDVMKWILVWGLIAVVSAVLGALLAAYKNRDSSSWAAWCFLMPPLLVWLAVVPKNRGPRPQRQPLDDLDSNSRML